MPWSISIARIEIRLFLRHFPKDAAVPRLVKPLVLVQW